MGTITRAMLNMQLIEVNEDAKGIWREMGKERINNIAFEGLGARHVCVTSMS
jgi:hypothetical protein